MLRMNQTRRKKLFERFLPSSNWCKIMLNKKIDIKSFNHRKEWPDFFFLMLAIIGKIDAIASAS